MDARDITIKQYDYPLPNDRIAIFPLAERDRSKLLIYNRGAVSEDVFASLPSHLPEGALMVFNNTRVIQARLLFHKDTGATIELFLLEPAMPADYAQNFARRNTCSWHCLVGNLKKWRDGELKRITNINGNETLLTAKRATSHGAEHRIVFSWTADLSWAELLEAVGKMPIPPYLNRKSEDSDKTAYQTVYSKIEGSVAAPTAGLHFTPSVLSALDLRGLEREEVTLHVGAGTFRPVKSDTIGGHEMHTEHIAVQRHTIEALLRHKGQAIAVGTTSVRTLESLYYMGIKAKTLMLETEDTGDGYELHIGQWEPYALAESRSSLPSSVEAFASLLEYMDKHGLDALHSSTQIIIAPGYRYRIVKAMLTNFHQPQSTLLLLVSAFIGDHWRQVYDYALTHQFRFLSYGDSSLLIP